VTITPSQYPMVAHFWSWTHSAKWYLNLIVLFRVIREKGQARTLHWRDLEAYGPDVH
jgi:uncharacterized membrane protein